MNTCVKERWNACRKNRKLIKSIAKNISWVVVCGLKILRGVRKFVGFII